MGKISIQFFQPIASYLEYHEPGGFNLETDIDAPVPFRNVISSLNVNGINVLQQLQSGQFRVTVAINGRQNHLGLDAEVRDGDKVSILPIYGGG